MALDDPKFRPAVRFTLKSVVVVLWTPIFLLVVAMSLAPSVASRARRDAERLAREQRLRSLAICLHQQSDKWQQGDFEGAIDAVKRLHERERSETSPRETTSDAIALEFATAESIAHMTDPANTWIIRERVPDSLAPPLAVFGDGHVAPLER